MARSAERGRAVAAELTCGLSRALDMIEIPCLLLDHALKIQHANGAARTLMPGRRTVAGVKLLTALPQLKGSPLFTVLEELRGRPGRRRIEGGIHDELLPASIDVTAEGIVLVFDGVARKRLDRMQWELLDGIAHHFQTPLTSIRGYAETLLDKDIADPETSLEFVNRIYQQSSRLASTVNRLLFLSRLQSMRQTVELRETDLRIPVIEAVDHCLHAAEEKGLGLALAVPEQPLLCPADYNSAYELVYCLVDNAVKYTPYGGEIKVELSVERRQQMVRLSVQDNGPGIAVEHQQRIFDRFFRAQPADKGVAPGVGLGLALVKSIAEAHGGIVTVESAIGQGTRFTFSLPLVVNQV